MTQEALNINKETTALVLIDLQKGIVGREGKPLPTNEVVKNASMLADAFRKNSMPVFLVHVNFTPGTALKVKSDSQMSGRGDIPADWADIVPEIGPKDGDVVITKRQWGAFYGTDLELQLRRRGIDTIVLGGIATTYGVESTARFAYEYGFNQIFPEDAMTDLSEEAHHNAINYVLKRIGRVRITEDILKEL
ncbi:hydrolase [uncultured archaeon]|nr:hydrolase [uncultured archaeon]